MELLVPLIASPVARQVECSPGSSWVREYRLNKIHLTNKYQHSLSRAMDENHYKNEDVEADLQYGGSGCSAFWGLYRRFLLRSSSSRTGKEWHWMGLELDTVSSVFEQRWCHQCCDKATNPFRSMKVRERGGEVRQTNLKVEYAIIKCRAVETRAGK